MSGEHFLYDDIEAIEAITAFLTEFDVTCLRSYLRSTAIPPLESNRPRAIVLVSDFVRHIQENNQDLFKSFVVLVQGHMLANALLCPDLEHATQDYRRVTFYLDTPLLVQRLGLEGKVKQEAARELIELLKRLRGRIVAFEHSVEELQGVVAGAALYVDSPDGRGAIVAEAKRAGTTRSDLLIFANSIERMLSETNIEIDRTPRYINQFQIDETAFEEVLDDWVGYRNPRAKLYDINSVRSIYVLRATRRTPTVERAGAILLTSNHSLAEAAWQYGQQYESSRDVSSVITDFTIANAAWLKAPVGAPNVPRTQLLAFAYAALEPSDDLLDKFMAEIDRLQESGSISAFDHELLRSSPNVYPELMGFTLGDASAISDDTVKQTLERVSSHIKSEESQRLAEEQDAHRTTQEELTAQSKRIEETVSRLYWRCHSQAKFLAWTVSIGVTVIVSLLFLGGLLSELGLTPNSPLSSVIVWGASAILMALGLTDMVLGFSVKGLHGWMRGKFFKWLILRESKSVGINLEEEFGGSA